MIITSTVGKMDAVIGRFEGPLMAYMEKEEGDFAKQSLKNTLYNVRKSKHYSESVAGLTGVSDFIATDGPIPYDSMEEGYPKTFIHTVFKKGLEIKRELVDDARIIDMQNQGGALVDSANRTMERFVHAPFNNATAATFNLAGKDFVNVGADGVVLGSTAHTSKTGRGANQSNLTTNTLTVDNLKTAEDMMQGFKTDIGEMGNFFPDTIIVPWELRNTAWEITQTVSQVGSALNNKNPYESKYKVIVSRWLTDANNWFLVDSNYMKKCLFWIDRIPLEVNSKKDWATDNWQIKAYMRWALGWTDYRWVVVNNPT